MHSPSLVEEHADALLTSARGFQLAAVEAGSSEAAPAALASLEETLRILSAGWQHLAADAAATGPGDHLPRAERRLVGVLQDVGAAFVRCSRVCRDAEYVMAHLSPPASAGAGEPEPVFSPAEPS
jgi:hypothetical protein